MSAAGSRTALAVLVMLLFLITPAARPPPPAVAAVPCALRSADSPAKVLLPGAGLARLCVEVAAAGFAAQGNEFSYFMLLTASFMLNHTACSEQWMIHPWLHSNVNNVRDQDQLRGVLIPDVQPAELVQPGLLSMCAGDFVVRGEIL